MIQLSMLRHFLSVAEHGSFTVASERLALSQSVISRSIMRLEELIGTVLFERTTRSVKLTPAGAALLLDARTIIDRLKTASDKARHIGLGEAAKLRVGVCVSVNTLALARGLPEFRKNWPMIDVELVVNPRPSSDALRAGQIDVAVMRLEQISEPGLEWRVIARDPLMAAVPSSWNMGKRAVHLAELADRPWIMPDPARWPALYDRFVRLCLSAGFEPQVVSIIRDRDTAMLLVSCGVGAFFWPRQPGLTGGSGGDLLEIEGTPETYTNDTAIAWLKTTACPNIAQFVDCICGFADEI